MMFQDILQYKIGSTIYHRLHPFTKLLCFIIFMLISWLSFWAFIFALIFTIISAIVTRSIWTKSNVSLYIWSTSILFTVNALLFSLSYPASYWLLDQAISLEGVYLSSLLTGRIIIIMVLTQIFFATTTPEELEDFLFSLRLPASLIISFTLTITFIPIIFNEYKRIYEAQLIRGLAQAKKSKRIFTYITSALLPLIISSLNRATRLAEVLEIYGAPPKNRTQLSLLKIKRIDIAMIFLSVFLAITSIILAEALIKHLIHLLPYF